MDRRELLASLGASAGMSFESASAQKRIAAILGGGPGETWAVAFAVECNDPFGVRRSIRDPGLLETAREFERKGYIVLGWEIECHSMPRLRAAATFGTMDDAVAFQAQVVEELRVTEIRVLRVC